MNKIILSLLLLSAPSFAADNIRLISVKGEGEVKVKPDIASIQLHVVSKAKDAKSAQEKNAAEMARVMKALKSEFGLDEKDIQTSGFNLNPEYRYEQKSGKQVFLGFTANHSLTAKVRKLETVGPIIDSIPGKGKEDLAVNLGGVSFDVEDRRALEVKALEVAMQNARARADALAKFSKRGIKDVLRISDSNVQYEPYQLAAGNNYMMDAAEAAPAAKAARPATQISTGEIEVSATVSADFELN